MSNRKHIQGFILPATVLLGLGISIISVTFMQYVTSASQTLNGQTYTSLAQEAAQAGVTYALACAGLQVDPTTWSPLKPNSDCAGSQDPNISPYVGSVAGQWQSTFSVAPATVINSNQKKVVSTGSVQIIAGGIIASKVTVSQDVTIITTLNSVTASSGNSITDIQSDTHSCAIANGQLYCWGDNGSGQLGIGGTVGSTVDQATPQIVAAANPGDAFYGKNITRVAVGTSNTCAVADGQLYCWGDNTYGQLGDGTKNTQTTPKLVPTLASYKITSISLSQAATGPKSACAVTNGMAYCWGSNASQQLGQTVGSANTTDSLVPIRVYGYNNGDGGVLSGKKTQSASVGAYYGCSSTQGTIYCWGQSSGGGAAPAAASANPDGIADPANVKVIGGRACNITIGQLYCKGNNPGNFSGTPTIGNNPGLLTSGAASSFDADSASNSACTTDPKAQVTNCDNGGFVYQDNSLIGRIQTNVGVGNQYLCMILNGALACRGTVTKGQLGNGSLNSSQANAQWVDWSSGFGTNNALTNGYYSFAAGGQISAGTSHQCMIANGSLFCWGKNDVGQLGLGNTTLQTQPTYLTPEVSYFIPGVPHTSTTEKVAAGGNHTCAIMAHATQDLWEVLGWPLGVGYTPVSSLYCWGSNTYGELGIGNTTSQTSPQRLGGDMFDGTGDRITDISAGPNNTCAVAKYQLYCWGKNDVGQLGQAGSDAKSPRLVAGFSGKQVTAVSVGTDHVCAIADGDGYCWGDNTYNQTGSASKPANASAGKITTGVATATDGNVTAAFTSITAGNGFTCATINGTATCWGKNDKGQTGTGVIGTVSTPTPIGGGFGGLQADAISAGDTHACAVLQGNIYCWGDNTDGRTGNGVTTNWQSTPLLVNTGAAAGLASVNIAAGGATSCSVSNGDILCWGNGDYGQIGTGGLSSSTLPLKLPYYRKTGQNTISPIY